jgi:predicted acetyltransferase
MTASEDLVPPEEQAALAAMMQDYITDMAAFVPGVRPGQAYPHFDLYWSEPDSRWPFWLCIDDAKAGFALVRHTEGETQMAEFFVARSFRRTGIGLAAARRLIVRFPGRWRITQRQINWPAIAFWHRVLDGFAAYDEETTTTDAVRREQRFVVP